MRRPKSIHSSLVSAFTWDKLAGNSRPARHAHALCRGSLLLRLSRSGRHRRDRPIDEDLDGEAENAPESEDGAQETRS